MQNTTTIERPRGGADLQAMPAIRERRSGGLRIKPSHQYVIDLSLLALACAVLFFFRLGSTGIIDPGDGYYSEGAREMMETGQYLLPQLNYQTFFGKPILIYWLISAAYHAFGVNEFAARIPSAVAATVLCFSVYMLARSLGGRRAGLISSFVFATCPEILLFGRISCIDMTFSAFLGVAICAAVQTLFLYRRVWMPVLWIAVGLSILTKGPAGLVFFGVTAATYLLIARPNRFQFVQLLKRLELHFGLPILAAIALPWYIMAGLATNWLWPRVFFLYENFGRFAGVTNHHHSTPWFYIPILGYSIAPWVVFLPNAVKAAFTRELAPVQEDHQHGILFVTAWVLGVFVLLSLSGTQLPYYILPVLAPATVLIGCLLERWSNRSAAVTTPALFRHASLLLAILGPFGAIAGVAAVFMFGKDFAAPIPHLVIAGAISFWVGLTIQYALLRSDRVQACMATLLATFVAVMAALTPVGFTIADKYVQEDLRELCFELKPRHETATIYASFNPSAMFYLQEPVDCVFDINLIKSDATSTSKPQLILTREANAKDLFDKFPNSFQTLEKRGKWMILLAHRIRIEKQPTLEYVYSHCLNTLITDRDLFGPLGVPFAGGVKPHKANN